MKKLFVIMAIVLMAIPAMATDQAAELTFEWNQASSDLPFLKEWGLYVMTASGGVKPAPIVVQYTTGTGPFTTEKSFTVTGMPGTTVRRFFVLDAVSKNGNRTGFSNEVFYDFVIPFSDVTTPMSLKVTVKITP